MNIPEKISNLIFARAAELGLEAPDPESDLFLTGLLDSFALASLVSAIEEELNLEIPDAEVDERKLSSLSAISKYLDEMRAQR